MRVTSDTLYHAAEIAANSVPCRLTLKTGDGRMCILGCVLQAKSIETKKSFNTLAPDGGPDVMDAIEKAIGKRLNMSLASVNDGPRFAIVDGNHGVKVNKLRNWQVARLTSLADQAFRKEMES